MAIQELTRTVAVLKALGDLVKAQLDEIKEGALLELEDLGVERAKATMPDGTLVAHVTRVAPVGEMKVLDEYALTEWAKEHASDLVEHVPEKTEVIPAHDRLRIGAVEELLARVKEDGEMFPGIGVHTKNPYLMVKYAPHGRDVIAEGLRQSWLVDGVVQRLLTTGDDDA